MTVPRLILSAAPAPTIAADVLVLGVSATDDGPRLHADGEAFAGPEFDSLRESLSAIGITGAADSIRRLQGIGAASSLALIGLGSAETDGSISADALRSAAGAASRQLVGVESLVLALPVADDAQTLAVLEGSAIGAYAFTEFRQASLAATKLPASEITVVTTLGATDTNQKLLDRAVVVATAMESVRNLVNAPADVLYPETFAAATVDLVGELPIEIDILREPELAAGGFGGILGVGQGSSRGPRLIKLSYSPSDATTHLALVGKGITFDTGGLSLKPAAGMVGMKDDMAGAATVMAVVVAAAKLALPVRLTAWLCMAENMPSGSAIRPNDVLRMRGGRTVEVLNTDAEGRLVMADGIVAAGEEQPDAIIDVATLTGAQRVALGDRYSGVMGDDTLVDSILAAGASTGEQLWPMPLPGELRALLNSDVADIANAKIGNTAAGMLVAGVFLQEFVGTREDGSRIPWAHIDIAGPAVNNAGPWGFTGKGATAVTVRALLALAEASGAPSAEVKPSE
ncbi:leucyl aminopeptidase [Lacisediminihabitans changchengi]|uniref:Probable cytosol aminopeptidase n=1 Tax=Lacisediminihabitans changchengi TaxID=2787634 RepID=A0A934W562_9MICO|nr:leucyl aminopeptidase [Lacisediminihabitans changchengi]MBK4346712.1 leucyl aminopeptidase [Lacisediminihabitans changchengi]MBK4348165.1 leucyl aminopeptidase [Lacisediminihabitans changchengi]